MTKADIDLAPIKALSVPQKLEIIEELWEDIMDSDEAIPDEAIPEWHFEELDRRMALERDNPPKLSTLDEAMARIRARHG